MGRDRIIYQLADVLLSKKAEKCSTALQMRDVKKQSQIKRICFGQKDFGQVVRF